jgi:hypothetical protein
MTNEPTEETDALLPAEINSRELAPAHFYHRDPAYRPWVIAAAPKRPTPYEEILAMMARHVRYAVIASRIVFIFSIVIALDLLLPKAQHEVTIVGYHRSAAGTVQMKLNDGSVINVSEKALRKLKTKTLTVSRSRFFNVPYRLTDKENHSASVEISLYGNFIFGPLVLLLTSLVGVLHKKGVELRFNLGVASVVLAMLNIAFMHVHKF